MKVLVVAKSAEDPSTRYRVDPLTKLLWEQGDEVRVYHEPGLVQQLSVVLKAASMDLVIIQRKLLNPLVSWLLGKSCLRLVFDHDDAIFLKSSGEPSTTRGRKYAAVVRAADLVLGGNTYLCESAAALGAKTSLVPTCVDVGRYPADQPKNEELSLVWIGSRSTSRYLEQARDMLEAVGRSCPGLTLRIISDFDFELSSMKVLRVDWSQETEAIELARSHIGIAPMADDAWTRGKCALKVIQYMAAGLPVISSNVGANRDVIRDGETGLLVSTESDWIGAVSRLVASEELRRGMGDAGRQIAEQDFNLQVTARRIVSELTELSRV